DEDDEETARGNGKNGHDGREDDEDAGARDYFDDFHDENRGRTLNSEYGDFPTWLSGQRNAGLRDTEEMDVPWDEGPSTERLSTERPESGRFGTQGRKSGMSESGRLGAGERGKEIPSYPLPSRPIERSRGKSRRRQKPNYEKIRTRDVTERDPQLPADTVNTPESLDVLNRIQPNQPKPFLRDGEDNYREIR
ncbi:MAG: hypothetical protein Q4C70_10395, partial [Planctomycetia bacterium]|nr:hypothetical protein [Planctomycetia bacterium]